MQKSEYVFIVNPAAGAADPDGIIDQINKVCRAHGLDYQIIKTEYPKHATEIAAKLVKSKAPRIIFSVGGDGTLNEALQGFVNGGGLAKHTFGVIPHGSCNDFFATFSEIKEERPLIDLGILNHKNYFLNVAGMGFDTAIAEAVEKFRKPYIPVRQRYHLAIIDTMIHFKPMDIEFKVDGVKKREKFMIVAAGNGKRVGGEYFITPDADLQDGKLDIGFCDEMSKLALAPLFGKVKKGTHGENPNIHFRKTDHIVIESEAGIPLQVDGEIFNARKHDIRVKKQAIKMFNDQKLINEIINFN
jgi:YegS/Rv2252/BmrU family lipid kinase